MRLPAIRQFRSPLQRLTGAKATLRRLARDNSALAMVEFAFTAPIVLSLGMLGTETAYFVITHMKVSQIAMQLADNVSRVGENDVLGVRRVYESDVNEALVGAEKLGEGIDLFENGRVIISTLQRNSQGGQWIAWQRCRGAKQHTSSYGSQGNGSTGTNFAGMGTSGSELTAAAGTAVIFVEIAYDFPSLTPFDIFENDTITYTAAFNIRDTRALGTSPTDTGIYQLDASNPDPVASCNTYSANRPA